MTIGIAAAVPVGLVMYPQKAELNYTAGLLSELTLKPYWILNDGTQTPVSSGATFTGTDGLTIDASTGVCSWNKAYNANAIATCTATYQGASYKATTSLTCVYPSNTPYL